MGHVAVIGEEVAVAGYALAGALVLPAADDEAVRDRWRSLGDDVSVVVLTRSAADALALEGTWASRHGAPLTVVIPS